MNKSLWVMLAICVALPILANAAVYKWKDKDGITRYSDTPPPSNVQQLPVNGKKPVSIKPPAAMTVEEAAAAATSAASGADAKKKPEANADKSEANSDGDAEKRQKDAEEEKRKSEQKEAELKVKQQNCSNSKANLNTYQQGGRIRKNNESGERAYLSDAEIAQGLAQAQKDVEQFCSE